MPRHRFEDEIATVQARVTPPIGRKAASNAFQVHKLAAQETRKPRNAKQVAEQRRFSYQPFLSLEHRYLLPTDPNKATFASASPLCIAKSRGSIPASTIYSVSRPRNPLRATKNRPIRRRILDSRRHTLSIAKQPRIIFTSTIYPTPLDRNPEEKSVKTKKILRFR